MDVAVNAVCDCADASVDACVSSVDEVVQAAVETSDAFTVHEPPVEFPPVASPLADDVPAMIEPIVDQSDLPSAGSTETLLGVPDDTSVDGSLTAGSAHENFSSAPGSVSVETSPVGPSLLDSDDEPIASHLPGYLNSLKDL